MTHQIIPEILLEANNMIGSVYRPRFLCSCEFIQFTKYTQCFFWKYAFMRSSYCLYQTNITLYVQSGMEYQLEDMIIYYLTDPILNWWPCHLLQGDLLSLLGWSIYRCCPEEMLVRSSSLHILTQFADFYVKKMAIKCASIRIYIERISMFKEQC